MGGGGTTEKRRGRGLFRPRRWWFASRRVDPGGPGGGRQARRSLMKARAPSPPPAQGLLLHLEFGVDDVLLAAAGTGLAVAPARAAGRATAAGTREVLGHRRHRRVQVADRLLDGLHVVALHRLLDAVHRTLDGGLVALRQLAAQLLQALLDLVYDLVGLVAGVDQLPLPPVLLGVRLGVAAHLLDVRLAQAARRLDADLLLLARLLVLGGDVQDAVGVDVEGDVDLRHAARRRRDVLQVELPQQAVVGRQLA